MKGASRLLWIAWFMLVKGNGPAKALPLLLTLLEAVTVVPTLGTTESGGQTTLGDLNCTCELLLVFVGAVGDKNVAIPWSGSRRSLVPPSEIFNIHQ